MKSLKPANQTAMVARHPWSPHHNPLAGPFGRAWRLGKRRSREGWIHFKHQASSWQQFFQPPASQSQTSTRSQLPLFVKCAYLWLRTLGDPPKFGVLGGDLKMSSIFFRNSSILPFTSGSSPASFSIWLNSPSLIICKSICGCLEMGSHGIPSRHHSFQVSSSHGRPWLDDTCKYPH